jgi:hypothetical protein
MRTLIQKILFVRPCSKKMRYSRHTIHMLATMVAVTLVVLGLRNAAEAADIFVTTTEQRVSGGSGCSLQEAIYSANLHDNLSIDGVNPDGSDNFVRTNCVPGTGNDTIVLPAGATFSYLAPIPDIHSHLGPATTPIIFSNITIEGNGATLSGGGRGVYSGHAFSVGTASVALPNGVASVVGTGSLTLRHLTFQEFLAKGGDGGGGGGGGMGAGGAIYVSGGQLTVENCTFVFNSAVGGDGGPPVSIVGGGGGGLGGNGGLFGGARAKGNYVAGGGGGGSRGNGGTRFIQDGVGGGGGGTGTDSPGEPGGLNCGAKGGSYGSNGDSARCPGGGGGGGWSLGVSGWDCQEDSAGPGGNGGFGGGGGASGGNFGGVNVAGGKGGFGGGAGCCSNNGGGKFGGGSMRNGGGGAALGGAIFNDNGSVKIRNSTFFSNEVSGGSFGSLATNVAFENGDAKGSAIFSLNGDLEVFDSTIANNEAYVGTGGADGGGALVYYQSEGGSGQFLFANTIVANNFSFDVNLNQNRNDCDAFADNQIVVGAGNLVMTNNQCPGVVTTADPQLGPLQMNGGNTPTMAITRTSPAFNAADPGSSRPTDQRGQVRPAPGMGGVPDIGAFELCLIGPPRLQRPCPIFGGQH